MKNKLLIWDIDGTLIDCKGSGRRAMDKTFQKLFSIDNGFKTVKMSGRLDWQIVSDAIKIHGVKDCDINSFFDEYAIVLDEELKVNMCGVVLPGVREILEATQINTNIYHVLGTGNCEQGAKLKLSHIGIETFFELGGYGNEDLERWEIIDKVINNAKNHYSVEFLPEDIYVIGDTLFDIECGKKLGVKSVAVATGSCGFEELLNDSPDFIFKDFKNTNEFLKILNS